ncbi:MAG: acetate--CoA ligase family protein, partial [Gammaproteobacteria bacterium]|nr:acetate--CoA ligase family protein [Gammaproteobacteria bacterium]
YLVNPRHQRIEGARCYASMSDLPEVPDLVVLGVGSQRLEAALDEAIAIGVGGAVIFSNCFLPDDRDPPLLERLRKKSRAVTFPVCGGNCMGFYNYEANILASFQGARDMMQPPGVITLIAHSGSVFVMLDGHNPRYRYNLVVSAGQEIGASVADYMDYALEQRSTRVIALFIETVRDPEGFVAALQKAVDRDIPVVVVKVGRTEESARLAHSHSGAMAGDDAAFNAVLERYGALRAHTLDELINTAVLLSQPRRPGTGGLAAVLDSGGLRELLMDLAYDLGVPFAQINADTTTKLATRLVHGLEPVNPLDAAGEIEKEFSNAFDDCLRILLDDPDTAIGAFEFEARDHSVYQPKFLEIAKGAVHYSTKPFFVFNSFGGTQNDQIAAQLLDASVPVINGADNALKAVGHVFSYRDFRTRAPALPLSPPDTTIVEKWRALLTSGNAIIEASGLQLLNDFGVAAVSAVCVGDKDAAVAAARYIGYPVAVKCAVSGVHHKSDVDGVRLKLCDDGAVAAAYDELASRLGNDVVIEAMVDPGVEIAFGMVNDAQFGPMVMLGAGGVFIEVMRDRRIALAPVDLSEARRLIDELKVRPLLDGLRGQAAVDLDKLAVAFARFSTMASTLGDYLNEVDVNPVVAGSEGCIAVDALVIAKRRPADAGNPKSMI